MQTPLAQAVALICHANAALRGIPAPQFFPGNSTCQFCESITFCVSGKPADSEPQTAVFADSPDAWMRLLPSRSAIGLKLRQQARNQPGISDRNASGFVGGGRIWAIEVMRKGSVSEFWLYRWEVGDRNAPDRKIWHVSYRLVAVEPTKPVPLRALEAITIDLCSALAAIRAFAEAQQCNNFVRCFDDALHALDHPEADIGYHKDLYPAGCLAPQAVALLKAAQSSWVFGGMGSWNDMGFQDKTQQDYERVSDHLFNLLTEAIEAAASSSSPASAQS